MVESHTRHLARTRVDQSGIGVLSTPVWLEVDLQGELPLPRRPRLLELSEGWRRVVRVGAGSEDVVDVGEIGAVEEIEHFNYGIEVDAAAEAHASAEAEIDRDLRGQRPRVPADT